MMTFETVASNYNLGRYTPSEKVGHRAELLPANTVIDEDQSVKWNREKVEQINAERQADFERKRDLKIKLRAQFVQDLYEAAKNEYNINSAQAQKIYDYVMSNTEHDYMCAEFVNDYEEFCDFFTDLNATKED
jgi:hypothetical protein